MTYVHVASSYGLLMMTFLVAGTLAQSSPGSPASSTSALPFRSGDLVAFVGGETAVQEESRGPLESLLTAGFPVEKVRYRNFAWEGDTVFEQPRDMNFPNLLSQLVENHATVIIAWFGRSEALAGSSHLQEFISAYDAMCDRLSKVTPRLILLTPVPFEKPADPAAIDPSSHNADVKAYSDAIVALARRRGLMCVNLLDALSHKPLASPLTINGMRLSPAGGGCVALATARGLGLSAVADRAGSPGADGKWPEASMEALRDAIVDKNTLWFRYSRPTNWAFLGGDRTSVASSHDHKNPAIRWFPGEMQEYVPLIEKADKRIDTLAIAAGK